MIDESVLDDLTSAEIRWRHGQPFAGVATNSGDVRPGDLFVAVRGARDGHAYVHEAVRAGASAIIVSEDVVTPDGVTVVTVPDTVKALQELGAAVRARHAVDVLAITGSVGKLQQPLGCPPHPASPVKILMVGFNSDVLQAIDRMPGRKSVTVIEEPHLWQHLGYEAAARRAACYESVLLTRYQQSDDYTRHVDALGAVDVILAGREYAVEAAARLATRLGLPGMGLQAAASMRDKLVLRDVAERAGIPGPAFREVMGPNDVHDFVREHGPCVLKPSNRHANLGVVKVANAMEVAQAWSVATKADEGAHLAQRPMSWRYLVETELTGTEYSTEALISDGEVVFLNITRKCVAAGRFPIEIGHDVPGADPEEIPRFERSVEQLVDATAFETGIVHAEWIDTPDGLCLVESAARLPSGRIPDLIELAYGFNLEGALVHLLNGADSSAISTPQRSASVGFLMLDAEGVVTSITGMDSVIAHPQVAASTMLLHVGKKVAYSRSSWDRVGYVTVHAPSRREARELADQLVHSVRIEVTAC